MVITITRVTHWMHDIVQTLQDGPKSAEEIHWSEGRGQEKSLRKHGKISIKHRVTRPLQHVATVSFEAKTSVWTSSPSSPLHNTKDF